MREHHIEIPGLDKETKSAVLAEQERATPDYMHKKPEGKLAEILAEFDFQVLEEIFKQQAHKSGVAVDNFSILRSDRFLSEKHLSPGFSYKYDRINLWPYQKLYYEAPDFVELENKQGYEGTDWHKFAKIWTLKILVHEEAHAAGRVFVDGFGKDYVRQEAGYHVDVPDSAGKPKDTFLGFNEGVTDKISDEVLAEYAQRTGAISARDIKWFYELAQKLEQDGFRPGYLKNIKLVDTVVARLADKNGLSTDVVWGAIKQGFYHGSPMENADVKKLFNQNFFPISLDRLAMVKTPEECGDLTKGLELLNQIEIEYGPSELPPSLS